MKNQVSLEDIMLQKACASSIKSTSLKEIAFGSVNTTTE
jgi:hypothetical protein